MTPSTLTMTYLIGWLIVAAVAVALERVYFRVFAAGTGLTAAVVVEQLLSLMWAVPRLDPKVNS